MVASRYRAAGSEGDMSNHAKGACVVINSIDDATDVGALEGPVRKPLSYLGDH